MNKQKKHLDSIFREGVGVYENSNTTPAWNKDAVWAELEDTLHPAKKRRIVLWPYAAAMAGLLIGAWWLYSSPSNGPRLAEVSIFQEIPSPLLTPGEATDAPHLLAATAPEQSIVAPEPPSAAAEKTNFLAPTSTNEENNTLASNSAPAAQKNQPEDKMTELESATEPLEEMIGQSSKLAEIPMEEIIQEPTAEPIESAAPATIGSSTIAFERSKAAATKNRKKRFQLKIFNPGKSGSPQPTGDSEFALAFKRTIP